MNCRDLERLPVSLAEADSLLTPAELAELQQLQERRRPLPQPPDRGDVEH